MDCQTERGQILIESVVMIGLVTLILTGGIFVILKSHQASKRYEFHTKERGYYDQEMGELERVFHKLLSKNGY